MGWLDAVFGREPGGERRGGGGDASVRPRPRVLLDLVHRDGLFTLALKNHGDAPARDVETAFDRPLGVERNEKDLSDLPAFTEVPYMVPGKTVEVFLGTTAALLPPEGEAREIRATVTYRDAAGRRYADDAAHDPEIYRHAGSVTR